MPFRDDLDARFDRDVKNMGKTFAGLAILSLVVNLALLAGAIVVVVLVLRALGVIG